jgi:hypothetical protein
MNHASLPNHGNDARFGQNPEGKPMRCKACDKLLSDFEATRKYEKSKEFVDLCNDCFRYVPDVQVKERPDLQKPYDFKQDL